MNVNPMVLVQMIKQGKNPQQLMMSVLQNQANTPLTQNLLSLARQGRYQEFEQVIRNVYSQQGGQNFDEDFKVFKQNWGL